MSAILLELKTRLLAKLKNAMVDGTITNAGNITIIEQLNENLLAQIGEDPQEFSAFGTDANSAGFNTNASVMSFWWNYLTQASTQSAGTFLADSFNPEVNAGVSR
jgi:hypothetical protein